MPPPAGFQKAAPPQPPPRGSASKSAFTNLVEISNETIDPGTFINAIGIVTDCQAPIKTRKDFKTTWTLKDRSNEEEYSGVLFDIFRPAEKDMPRVRARDVIVLSHVKVQRYSNTPRLIAHHSTTIHIYTSSKIPKPPATAKVALVPQNGPQPTDEINRFVCEFYHSINKCGLPDEHEFRERQEMSLNVKDKFNLLSGVQEGNFYDMIVRVVRDPYFDFDNKATLYVSDYTENEHFHLQTWQGLVERQAGDPWGYTSTQNISSNRNWHGPDGKRSMQITVYPPHANVLLDDAVAVGTWLHLRNVQIKYGSDRQFYEGFLREDSKYPTKVNATVIDLKSQTRETADPRLKQAVSRYRESEKEKKNLNKSINEAKVVGEKLKRKASEASLNDKEAAALAKKQRRKRKQEALLEAMNDEVQQPQQQQHQQPDQQVAIEAKRTRQQNTHTNPRAAPSDLEGDLNAQITCETHYEELTTITSMLEPFYLEKNIDGQEVDLLLPFVNRKYQSRVRVVGFFPPSLHDFAVGAKKKYDDFDILSDNAGDGSSSPSGSSGSEDDEDTDDSARWIWEWRFSLQLEDALPPGVQGPKSRVWVVIDNAVGQCLTDLDAADLSKNPKLLAKLRGTLAVLWGNLEEVKAQQSAAGQKKGSSSTKLEKPTLSSSDVEMEDDVPRERELENKPFMCCIQQYGVKDPNKMDKDAWVRMFGMFGVRIRV